MRGAQVYRFVGCGLAALLVAAGGAIGDEPAPSAVDFRRHIAPLLGKLGCNAASCHGAADGRGGFRLSLFGHDSAFDYRAISRDERGRRVDSLTPSQSLLLLKGAARIAHGGGLRFERDSWAYRVIERWIETGAEFSLTSASVERIAIQPASVELGAAQSARLTVVATFSDGSEADVTPWCAFSTGDSSVAEASADGKVTAKEFGDTAVVVAYGEVSATACVLVPRSDAGAESFAAPAANFIDVEIFRKLTQLRIVPSPLSGDAEFLRRVWLATIGSLPAPEETRRFLADPAPDKRVREIDRLLAHPLHAAMWATRFCEITGNQLDATEPALGAERAAMWHAWLRRRFAANRPYDEIAREILCAASRSNESVDHWIEEESSLVEAARAGAATNYESKPSLDLYWRRGTADADYPVEAIAERTAAAFLGLRIECARCHKHPFDRWTQADYLGFANVFSQVRVGMSPELRAGMFDLLERRCAGSSDEKPAPVPRLTEVFLTTNPRDAVDPASREPLPPKALGGPMFETGGDRRRALADWLLQPDNPYFARNLVNRVWQWYFSRGLVEPVDAFSSSNPPTHPELLDRAADDFRRSGYDFRRLERMILSSTTWQLSSAINSTNASDEHNYSRAYVRVLPAEAAWDILGDAVGDSFQLGEGFAAGMRAVEAAPSQVRDARLRRFFRVFQRPERARTCDCERATSPTVEQSLFLMSDSTLQNALATGRVAAALSAGATDEQILDDFFLATLTRFPTDKERETVRVLLDSKADRSRAWCDVLWALINTREFITNH